MSDQSKRPAPPSVEGAPRSAGAREPRRVVIRWTHALPVLLLAALATAWLARSIFAPERPPPPPSSGSPELTELLPDADTPEARAMPKAAVKLYWPAADGSGLVARDAEVFATAWVGSRAKQVVGLLLRGPASGGRDAPGAGDTRAGASPGEQRPVVAPLPSTTRLLQLFVDDARTAYVNLSRHVVEDAPGGSDWERLAVYSLVNSLVRSFPEIDRVQFLIEGKGVESLVGHLDLRHPLSFDERALAPPLEAVTPSEEGAP